jgi:iron complex transport system substrate-binding protein
MPARIASLVPSATEMLFALGLGERVAAVTHECDYPPAALELPRITRSVIPDGLGAAEIDAAVREVTEAGRALYELDEEMLARLDVDLIVTQALCAVCAVSYDDVRAIAVRLPTEPEVISLDPETLEEVLDDVPRLGAAAGAEEAAARLRSDLAARLSRVREAVAAEARPRVAALEWLDPPNDGGHWVPEMIEAAGGTDVLGEAGSRSRTATWEEIAEARPDIVLAMPCGWYVERSRDEALAHWDRIGSLGAEHVFAVDAASSFSRPGPRLVEGTELLAHLLHPGAVAAPAGVGSAVVSQSAAWA